MASSSSATTQKHAFLRSGRSRQALAEASQSQPSVRPVASSSNQQPSPAIPVATVMSPVPRSPRVSPEKVRETINQIRHDLQVLSPSPLFNRSASASPTNVKTSSDSRLSGETSRLSTSPGVPPPMSAELLSFMNNITSMLREQQTTSSLLLQRIADIEFANAERRENADLIRQTPSRSETRAAERELRRTTHQDEVQEREGPNTYEVTDDSTESEEEKYPADDIKTVPQVKAETVPATRSTAAQSSSVPDRVRSTVTMSSYSARESRSDRMPSLIDDEPISYPAQRLKQENVIRYNRLQKEEQERVSALTDIDRIEESASVLGSILSRAFTPAVRATLRAGKLAAGTRLTGKDRIAAVEEMKKSGVTFSGDRMKAPAYLKRLCSTVLRWDLNAGEVYQVMDSTMDRQAATWLQDTWAMTGELPAHVKPIEALLDSFMRLWMDQTTKRMFRDALKSLRMPTETATLDELNIHYAKFSEYLNGLRMCDKHVDMQDIIHEYFETLPNRVQAFIGTRYMSALSIAEVHAEAETALRTMHKRRTPKQDGDLGEVVSMHALTESISVNSVSAKHMPQRAKLDKRNEVCYHCGDKGHYAGLECRYINQAQTRRGQAAWADRNKNSDKPRPYDKDFYIARSRQSQLPSSATTALVPRSNSDGPQSSSPNDVRKKKIRFRSGDVSRSRVDGELKKVTGAPSSKKNAQAELDDEEEESADA